jgi:CHAT domain-containing protein/predicted ATPase
VPAGHPTAIHLTLLRHGDLIAVDLAETGALVPRSETHVDDAFLRDLAAEMEQIATQRAGGTERALARLGGLVFSHLLTEPARRRLRDAEPTDLYLRLDERLVHVPWELCHDGKDFLATKFRIGRSVITGHPIAEPLPLREDRDRLRILLVADPTETLPQAIAEAEQLCALLDQVPGVDVTLLSGRSVRRIPLLAALQEHDVVHFAGHSRYDPETPTRSGWRLAEGVLPAAELAKLRPSPFLVFSNSCEAATSAAWQGDATYEGHAFGIGSAFLLAGVRSYVGTIWVVHDSQSSTFATTCYRVLAAGGRLGEALQTAREAVLATHGREALTWASYLLYGDPAFRPLSAPSERAEEAPPPPEPLPGRETFRFDVSLAEKRHPPAATVNRVAEASVTVGREDELRRLHAAFDAARRGDRGVMLLRGPPGIGKTTLLEEFLAQVRHGGDAWIARGQAIEQYGAGEAYLPLLEALGRLGREPGGRALVEHLRRCAPTWLVQLPALLDPPELEALVARTRDSTRERMLRELAELLESATAERPLVIALEDLHWSDRSTIEAIAYVAQGRAPARVLLVGTYRPAEVKVGEHPLRAVVQEIRARRRGEEIRLEPLGEAAVHRYLEHRLTSSDLDEEIGRMVHRRTEGHPLFLVNVVDFALREGLIAERSGRWSLRGGSAALASAVPEGLRPMIERQIESLSSEVQPVLEAAAVAGAEFSVAAVAAALESDPEEVDDRCEEIAWHGQLLRSAGMEEWPDGTLAGRYRFVHALYQNVLYDRIAEPRRIRLHRRIGERKAAAFGANAPEIAGELASHFEAARDIARALEHRERAGDLAVRRHADHEAIEHFERALHLLPGLPKGSERAQRELDLLVKLATPLMSTAGYAARQVEQVFDRAYALSRQLPPGPHLAPLLRGLVSFHQVRARPTTARVVGEELLKLCESGDDSIARLQAHYGHGVTLYDLAELADAERHLTAGLALYDPEAHATHVSVYGGYDPGVGCRCWLGWLHWTRGEPDRAVRAAEDGVQLAERLPHRFSLAFANTAMTVLLLHRSEVELARPYLARASAIVREDGFSYQGAILIGLEAWVALLEGRAADAIALVEQSLASHAATGAGTSLPSFVTILAYAKAFSGRVEEGIAHVDEAIAAAEQTRQRILVGPLYRSRGELVVSLGDPARRPEAAVWFQRARKFAHAVGARMYELQAATSLARVLRESEQYAEAREALAGVYGGFTEGFSTRPLREAKALLDEA